MCDKNVKKKKDPAPSVSIMEQIRILTEPPSSEAKPAKARTRKRPGYKHNHGFCDACGMGGDLLCCDHCLSSFHLLCQDPPMSEEDTPIGKWLCHKCSMVLVSSPSSKTSEVEAGTSMAAASTRNGNIENENINKKVCTSKLPQGIQVALNPNKRQNPLDSISRAASFLNPTTFKLPPDMMIQTRFPGDARVGPARTIDRKSICFCCNKSCKKAPLVACDFCPLFFHQDCLDPPLTALPVGLWMCPNHVEHFIDKNLVKTISCTERLSLWNKFSQPIDHESVQKDFVRRVQMVNAPISTKMQVEEPCIATDKPTKEQNHHENPQPKQPSNETEEMSPGTVTATLVRDFEALFK